ncbi:YrhA family protein [Sporolactobacillus laevolacticus]|uniref:YrhA family protein n=1 Tax=Sporolactobacillus laevolacticus TaxID=33018 RepID=UPI001267E12D|nr:YrhA family protein [Sporolactobacillus laevolacticus]
MSEVMVKLEELQSNFCYTIATPAKKENIMIIKKWVSDNVALDLWFPEYEEFLKQRDGIEFDGLVIFNSDPNDATKGFITANEIWRADSNYSHYVYFGDTDISWFAYDLNKKKYVELDKASSDFIESFDSFNQMLENVINNLL